MKLLFINSVCGTGSTGRICTDLAKEYEKNGDEVKIAYGRNFSVPEQFKKYAVKIGGCLNTKLHFLQTRLFDAHGFGSKCATKKFLKWAEKYNPDVLWLHNIHGYYINVELLFQWIKSRPNMQVKWTLHDCWAFTGHCAYFDYAKCDRWKNGCGNCPSLKDYPKTYIDSTKRNYQRKKQAFTLLPIEQLTIITPSKWLAGLVKESFLKKYDVEVINNKIDTSIFKPTPSSIKEKYGISDKKIILGVASVWDRRKGLEDFIKLSSLISDDYKIVLIGLSSKQIKALPSKILGLQRTESQLQLVQWYSAAYCFFNPTYEDNYPTVLLEAQACGTPTVSYDVGGCKEIAGKFGLSIDDNLSSFIKILPEIDLLYGEKHLC